MPYKAPWTLSGETALVPPAIDVEPHPGRDAFIALSVRLTGFAEIELAGTGVAGLYLGWLALSFPDVLPELLAAWEKIADDPDVDAALRRDILADPKLGPFARAILGLWYTATWNALPAAWSKAYGHHRGDVNQVFGAAYPEGLVWKAAHLHPTAAKPTGFGTWSFPPGALSDG
jgi:hypothetical protein